MRPQTLEVQQAAGVNRRTRWALVGIAVAVVLGLAGCANTGGDSGSAGRSFEPGTLAGVAGLRDVDLRLTRLVSKGKRISLPSETPITLRFGAPGKISGRSGVNRYFGSFEFQEGGVVNWPRAAFGMTRMAGPPEAMELESTFVGTLSLTERLDLAPDAARFTSGDGEQVLEFVR